MSNRLFFPYGNPRGAKVLVAAELAGFPVEHVDLPYDQLKTPEHLARHPLGKIPVLETSEGPIFESNAILRHIARSNKSAGLYGANPHQEALVDQWVDFVTTEMEPIFVSLVIPVLGYYPLESQAGAKAHADLTQRLQVLDRHLSSNKQLVGDAVTIADIQAAGLVNGAFRFIIDEQQRAALPNLVRWFTEFSAHPLFLKYFGRPRNCKVGFPALQITVPQPQPQQAQKEKKEQPKKEKPAPKPKEEKPKVEDDDEPPKKKEANPLDLLPPSTFNLDDWKRRFLAAKDSAAQKAEFEWFWQNFDDQGWSLWEITYEKEANEGTMLIKSNNTMNGFLQRTDPHFKKFAFAIHGVYGEEPNLQIQGAWLWRGTDIPFELRDHPSYEVHKFTKLEQSNEEQKKLFEEYWLNQTEDESLVKGLRARTLVYYR